MSVLGDWADPIASVVAGLVAVGTPLYLYARAKLRWWPGLTDFSQARQIPEGPLRYHFDAHVRALTDVYVPRFAARRGRPPGPAVATDQIIFDGSANVLLIGEPGSGKTALIQHAVAESARRWLHERGLPWRTPRRPVVVVRIAATEIVENSLQDALTAECAPWAPLLTQPPAPRRTLLICVDGLDGVADPDQRSAVLNRLAALAARPRPWRLLVTTRQLSEPELRTLDRFDTHHLTPFTQDDVARLAHAWFASPVTATAFAGWLEAQHLGSAARSPLLTAVAAVCWEAGTTDRSSPPDAGELFDRFVEVLLDASRDGIDGLLGQMRQDMGTAETADWLGEHRRDLVEAAATASAAGQDITDGVLAWIDAELPSRSAGRALRDRSAEILTRTGLFRTEGRRLVPCWPSLIEFLAAGTISPDLSPESWTTAMSDTSRHGLAVRALERASTPVTFLRDIAARPDGALAVGHLIAAGARVPDDIRADVIAELLTDRSPQAQSLMTTLGMRREGLACVEVLAQDVHRPSGVRHAARLFFAEQSQATAPPQPYSHQC